MRLRFAAYLLLLFALAAPARAQQDGLLQLDDPLHRFLLRQHALGRLPDAFLSHQPLSAYEARRYLDSLSVYADRLGRVDRQLYARFRGEAPGPGVETLRQVLPFAYRNGRNSISAEGKDYAIQIDPLSYFAYGRARRTQREDRPASVPVWQNTRGLRVAGHVGRYVFFETRLEENQRRDAWPAFQGQTFPRLGHATFDPGEQSYDYWLATGVAGLRTQHFEVRLGRDRNRWGFGENSLLLSNYATVYDQLQIRTTFWRLQYTNLFTSLASLSPAASNFVPRKYAALRRLALRLPARVEVAFFEAVSFASSDSLGLRDSGFDLSYLNPVIFLRAVDADRGSPDNALLGGGLSWVARPGLQLYTQVLIDELKVDQIGKRWWGNKWGLLGGLFLTDVPLYNLSLRLEYARLRPYLYSHQSAATAYVHYNDLLGHPAGPNAVDLSLFVDYQPRARLRAAFTLAYTRRGRNTATANYGSDPTASYETRVSDTDVRLLQGVRQNEWLVETYLGYEVLPDVYVEAALRAQSVDDAEAGTDRYVAPFVMLRWGLPFQSVRY